MIALDDKSLNELVYGGAVLGGGGGGSIEAGLRAGRRALAAGRPRLAALEEIPAKGSLVTLSGVGTIGQMQGAGPLDGRHTRALELFSKNHKRKICGLLASEVGPLAVTYGWLESALTGLPLVDAPCNGRAHPLGTMGSIGLHKLPRYFATTVAVGGVPGTDKYVELIVRANVPQASRLVRQTVASVGVPLAVVRNPVPASFVRRNAAVGGLSYARRVGRCLLDNLAKGLPAVLAELTRRMGGGVLVEGTIRSTGLADRKGFTVGSILLVDRGGTEFTIPVCNEYMLVLSKDTPLAIFPDLITLFDARTALPLTSAEVKPDQQVSVLGVPRAHLKLSTTMRDRQLLRPIQELLNLNFPSIGMPAPPSGNRAERVGARERDY